MGRLKTFSTIEAWQRDLGESLADILGEGAPEMLKRVFEREEKGDILADFKTYFATPMMQMWQETIAPTVREGFNLPGAFYSTERFEGVQKSGEQFLTQQVNPMLFSALESSQGRELQRQAIIANLMTGSQSLATAPTRAGVMAEEKSGSGAEIGALAGMALAGFTGVGALTAGGLEMGAYGSLIGGQF